MKGREREREIEGIGKSETSDFFFLFVVVQVANFVVHLSIQMFLTLS